MANKVISASKVKSRAQFEKLVADGYTFTFDDGYPQSPTSRKKASKPAAKKSARGKK